MRSNKEEETDIKGVHMERSKRSLPPTYTPSLVFSHGKKHREQIFCTLSDGSYHNRSIPEMRKMRCIGSCYGWLIMQKYSGLTECFLLNPMSLTKIHLPLLRNRTYIDGGVLTSSPSDSNCIVFFVSKKRDSFSYCRIGDNTWIEKDLGSEGELSRFCCPIQLISYNGNIYVFYYNGVFVINVHDDSFATMHHDINWGSYAYTSGQNYYGCFFVESCGEIFLIIHIYLGYSNRIFQTCDVFRLELSTMDLVQIDSLGDRIFLLGASSSASLSSSELGVKGNCVYIYLFTNVCTTLNRFDMEDGTITTTLPCPKKINIWDEPFWMVRKPQVKKEVTVVEEDKYNLNADLPPEIVTLILSRPFLGDCTRFRLACKSRIAITPPIRPHTSLVQYESGSEHLPWFLSIPKNNKGLCNYYHPIYSDAFITSIPYELAGAIVRHAKSDWLLMSKGLDSIFFFNPLKMEIIQLPKIQVPYVFVNISFSDPPTSSDCVVFGHFESATDVVRVYVYRKCENTWCHYMPPTPSRFLPSNCSPIFYDGLFYSLGKDGKLGVFNPNATKAESMWKLFPKAIVHEFSSLPWLYVHSKFFWNFIMEYESEIFSVFLGHLGNPVWVYKLDLSEMKWVRLESLGDKVIFLSHTTSVVVSSGLKGIGNRIYLPRFQGRDCVFYSLLTGKYHCFGGKGSREDWINSSEYWSHTWIQIKK